MRLCCRCGNVVLPAKYENLESITGNIVAAEVDLINLRLTGTEEDKRPCFQSFLKASLTLHFRR